MLEQKQRQTVTVQCGEEQMQGNCKGAVTYFMSDSIFRVEVQREEAVVGFGAQGAFVVGRVAVVSGEALQVDQVSATLEEDA